ncbi:hypothetical protein J437_LFUL013587 [Ladona fulva]|uniref:Uncharacterized protein n=1 Tax=Ladona fulva TaxID=123851 RepID=A0A8K0KAA7_LADFU|nr:hypothetical protein J437_LFUL013587 [Ladona fulva]
MSSLGLFLLLTLCSLVSSCSSDEDILEQSVLSIENVLDQNGDWETIVTNHLDPSLSPNNSKVDVKRKLVDEDGKKRMIVKVSLKGNFNQFSWGALRFHTEGARNIKVYKDGTLVKKIK